MTATGRAAVAIVAILAGVAFVIVGVIRGDAGAVTGGTSLATLVVGYTLGDRNGEKRLANALTVLDAERLATAKTAAP